MTGHAVLLTGGLATGKTTVAKEVVAIASTAGLRVAAIDLDWLGWTTPTAVGVDELISSNLTSVAANYAAAGIDHLVLARAIVSRGGVQVVATALANWELKVVRLDASRSTLERRIRGRDIGDELHEHLEGLDAMTQRVSEAMPGARSILNDGRDVRDVAREVMRAAGWIAD